MSKIYIGTNSVKNSSFGTSYVSEYSFLTPADPILENNSWEEIDVVAKRHVATNYWAVGDTKTDLGTDGVTRTFRIVEFDADGIIFEEVEIESNGEEWNNSNNVDDDYAYNNYSISIIRNSMLPIILAKFSNELKNIIVTSNIKVAKNGNSSEILTLTDKLFIEAAKEVGYTSSSVFAEREALTIFEYWQNHTSESDHIKRDNFNYAYSWWLRSPSFEASSKNCACIVTYSGNTNKMDAIHQYYAAPCFRIGTTQTGGLGKPFAAYSWAEIDAIAKAGDAANYWSVGDYKSDYGTDDVVRVFRIVNINSDGITMEYIRVEDSSSIFWDNNGYNYYENSTIRNTTLPAELLKFSNALQNVITTTNVVTAENGNSSTLVTTTDKLFLAAGKEVGSNANSVVDEQNALTTFGYYLTHTSDNDRIKYDSTNTARNWWLRSPCTGTGSVICIVGESGGVGSIYSGATAPRLSPFFRIGKPQIQVSTTLNNNSWDTIKQVCEAGDAANYWSVGDTKTDVGADGYTRTFRIADMSGLYNKHVVFEQVELEGSDATCTDGVYWNSNSNKDDENDPANWSISDMLTTILPDTSTRYSSGLQDCLTNTIVVTAKNGKNGTLVSTTSKLFLQAEKEVGYTSYSRVEEQEVLTIYEYYVTHTTTANHQKWRRGNAGTSATWGLRSPYKMPSTNPNPSERICEINGGNANYGFCGWDKCYYSPCFSF